MWIHNSEIKTCIYSNRVSDIVIYLGRLNQNGSNPHEISRTVIKVIKHPKYKSLDSSLALIQLSSSVTFSDYIKPVCLAAAGSVFVAGTDSWVTGWGLNKGEKRYFKITVLKFWNNTMPFMMFPLICIFILCDRIQVS